MLEAACDNDGGVYRLWPLAADDMSVGKSSRVLCDELSESRGGEYIRLLEDLGVIANAMVDRLPRTLGWRVHSTYIFRIKSALCGTQVNSGQTALSL